MSSDSCVPNRIAMHGMYDNHSFIKFSAENVDELLGKWRKTLRDSGDCSLCPVIVIADDKEVRRVGKMLHPDYSRGGIVPKSEAEVEKFRWELLNDPDIPRIMAATADAQLKSAQRDTAAAQE